MSKIALCLYGQMRTWEVAYNFLEKNLLNKLNPDIFIHTWSNKGGKPRADPSNEADTIKKKEISENEIIRQYKPKSIQVEEFSNKYYTNLNRVNIPDGYSGAKSTLPLLYKISACVELKKEWERRHDFKYDIVILTRPDIAFLKPLPPPTLKSEACVWQLRRNFQLVDDLVLIGPSNDIDKIAMCFGNVDNYLNNAELNDVMEILDHHCERMDVEVKNADANRGEDFEIIRYGTNVDIFDQNLIKQIIFILIYGDSGVYQSKHSLHYAARFLHERRVKKLVKEIVRRFLSG